MLTVVVCFDWSGNNSTRRPFASLYSVMPSTDVTRSTPFGRAGVACAGVVTGRAVMAGAAPTKNALKIANITMDVDRWKDFILTSCFETWLMPLDVLTRGR